MVPPVEERGFHRYDRLHSHAACRGGHSCPRQSLRYRAPNNCAARQRRAEPLTNRVRRDGKFFRLGDEKFYVKGVTYGPFAPNSEGHSFPEPEQVRSDFSQIRELGANCMRIYHMPPPVVPRPGPGDGPEDLPRRRLAEEPDVRRR